MRQPSRIIAALLLAPCLAAAPRGEHRWAVTVERDLVFGRGGRTELRLDIAWPRDGEGPFPAIVMLHGGAWRIGDRSFLSMPVSGLGDQSVIEYFASRGFVAISPSFRLVPTALFPAQLEDCKAAIRWLRANAARYKADPDRIAASGYSSGGHLACLLGLTDRADGFEGTGGHADQSSRVHAVVDMFGPTDLLSNDWIPFLERNVLQPLIGAGRAEKPELYRRASPMTYLRKDRRLPPFLVMHGAADRVVPLSQSKQLVARLEELGAKPRYVEVEGEGHGWYGPKLAETLDVIVEFLREQFK